jgi:hypothetical protein
MSLPLRCTQPQLPVQRSDACRGLQALQGGGSWTRQMRAVMQLQRRWWWCQGWQQSGATHRPRPTERLSVRLSLHSNGTSQRSASSQRKEIWEIKTKINIKIKIKIKAIFAMPQTERTWEAWRLAAASAVRMLLGGQSTAVFPWTSCAFGWTLWMEPR